MSVDKPLKLPRSLPIPGGCICVRLVSDKKMIEVAGDLVYGLWQDVNQTIYVRQTLSPEEREETFYHELHHAVTDMEWRAQKRIRQGQKEKECASTSPVSVTSGQVNAA